MSFLGGLEETSPVKEREGGREGGVEGMGEGVKGEERLQRGDRG